MTLDRLIDEYAITPTSDGERTVLELLVAEGYARRIESAYAAVSDVINRTA